VCICVGNARAGRAEFSGRSAVVVVRGNSSGSSRGCDVVRAESANGCGEAGIDQVSVAVVGLLHDHIRVDSIHRFERNIRSRGKSRRSPAQQRLPRG
jgi:hypothetical protein